MSGYQYPQKLSRVSVYGLKKVTVKSEGSKSVQYVKEYRHKKEQPLRAYCRMLLTEANERDRASFGRERVLVVINYNPNVKIGDIIEWGSKLLRIVLPPDYYEGRNLELKLTCELAEVDPALIQEDSEQ